MAQNYYEQIAAMRQERAQREHVNQLEEIKQNYAEAVQGRDEAARRGDVAEFESFDDWAADLEKRWQVLSPPPQHDPRLVNFVRRNSSFFEKYGSKALEA